MTGLDPRQFTPGELYIAWRARQSVDWERAAMVAACVVNQYAKKPVDPDRLNPYAVRKRPAGPVNSQGIPLANITKLMVFMDSLN